MGPSHESLALADFLIAKLGLKIDRISLACAIMDHVEVAFAEELNYENEITRLRAELAAKSKDAERYAWLRKPDIDVGLVIDKVTGEIPYDEGTRTGGYNTYEYRAGEELDAAIDAAMKLGEGNGR